MRHQQPLVLHSLSFCYSHWNPSERPGNLTKVRKVIICLAFGGRVCLFAFVTITGLRNVLSCKYSVFWLVYVLENLAQNILFQWEIPGLQGFCNPRFRKNESRLCQARRQQCGRGGFVTYSKTWDIKVLQETIHAANKLSKHFPDGQ